MGPSSSHFSNRVALALLVAVAVASAFAFGGPLPAAPVSAAEPQAETAEDLVSLPITVRGTGDVVRVNVGSLHPETMEFRVTLVDQRGTAVAEGALRVGRDQIASLTFDPERSARLRAVVTVPVGLGCCNLQCVAVLPSLELLSGGRSLQTLEHFRPVNTEWCPEW